MWENILGIKLNRVTVNGTVNGKVGSLKIGFYFCKVKRGNWLKKKLENLYVSYIFYLLGEIRDF